ncbi:MAG: amino acid adenylation domain-containing protein [Gemmatimonadetes bacterium]|nr:amino acid adenylation domain-containing protein [Gemmatimonadota bacterium]
MSDGSAKGDVIGRRTGAGEAPMSYAQEMVWLLDRATPGLTAYNVPRAFRLRGALDVAALEAALADVVTRHEVLRTTYHAGDHGPVQRVAPAGAQALPVTDLTARDASERESEVGRLIYEEAHTHFDLARDPMLRARLLRVGPTDHVLLLTTHHIASDGWSKGVLFADLSAAYAARAAGRAPAWAPLPIQYGDFAAWQRAALAGAEHAEHLAFWRERLAAPLPDLALPTDFARPAVAGYEAARTVAVLPMPLVERLRELGYAHGATPYMVLLAAYHAVLHRYTGQDDIVTGSPIAGRTRAETEGLIGFFANTLVMRTDLAGDPTFAELLERISDRAMGAYEHGDVPFEKLALDLREGQAMDAATPLFRCVLTMEDTIEATLTLGAATVEVLPVEYGQGKFDLTLLVAEVPEGLRLTLGARSDLFAPGYGDRFLGHVRAVIEAAVADADVRVSSIALPTLEERAVVAAAQGPAVDEGAPATLVSLFEQQAARVPNLLAVVGPRAAATAAGSVAGTTPLTYAELNARANQLGAHLRTLGVRAGTPVGLLLDRSADAFVGLMGILKAGGAYMPLATEAPAPRIAQQLRESGATVVVTSLALAGRVPDGSTVIALDRDADAAMLGALPTANLAGGAAPDDLAYVLYTSGSTGVPKGVAVTHANAVHYARAVSRVLADVPADRPGDGFGALQGWRFGMVSTLAADLGNTSVLPALLSGGTLHTLARDVTTDPARFAEYVSVHQFDVLKITPSHLAALTATRSGAELAAVLPRKWIVLGGEALRPALARTLLAAGTCRVLNHYGPTETTVGVLTNEATNASLDAASRFGAQTVPLGRPLANTRAWVLDAQGREQPLGIPGELVIGGLGVARGYLGRDDLTRERFITVDGVRAYRTGDRVRRLADGTIEFLGRGDDQVKVRGYRVEVGEIEQSLRQKPGVLDTVVTLHVPTDGEARLVAYVVPKQAGYAVSHADRPTPEKLRDWVAAQLPDYMVPSVVVMIDAIPLTPNGKVDRAKLPVPGEAAGGGGAERVAPRTPTEEAIAKIWRDAIRVLGRISKELGVRLTLRALFESPTVAQVASLVDAERQAKAEAAALEAALADVEGLSDADVAKALKDGAPPAP